MSRIDGHVAGPTIVPDILHLLRGGGSPDDLLQLDRRAAAHLGEVGYLGPISLELFNPAHWLAAGSPLGRLPAARSHEGDIRSGHGP